MEKDKFKFDFCYSDYLEFVSTESDYFSIRILQALTLADSVTVSIRILQALTLADLVNVSIRILQPLTLAVLLPLLILA